MLQDKGASNISTFELLSSGAVRQLRAHLLGADLQRGQAAMRGKGKRDAQPSSAASMSRHQVALLERLRSFAQAGLTPGVGGTAPMQPLVSKPAAGTISVYFLCSVSAACPTRLELDTDKFTRVRMLLWASPMHVPKDRNLQPAHLHRTEPQSLWRLQVRKLQQALAATEAFPVADSHEVPVGRTGGLRYGGSPFFGHSRSIGDGSSLGNGLAALSQPFKLRLAAASHEKQLVDYSVNVVRLS